MPTPFKALLTVLFLAVAAFSVFGCLASFEPGVSYGWKLGYAAVLAASAGAIGWIWRRPCRSSGGESGRDRRVAP